MKIAVIPNSQKPWAVKLAKEVTAFMKAKGAAIVRKNADASICIGGDGTIYYENYMKKLSGKIICIGSNSSFVAQATNKNWKTKLAALLKSSGKEALTLDTQINGRKINAISDVVMHTHDYRVVSITASINRKLHKFEGDGIIVATPTGSTGYAYSAGGPELAMQSKEMLVVPICPYRRSFRTLRLKAPQKMRIWADRTVDLVVDGIYIGRLKKGRKVLIKTGKRIIFA